MAFIHFMEFTTIEGTTLLQRMDAVDSIIETTAPTKGGGERTVIHLLLRNNNRVQVVGETRESIIRRLIAQGNGVIVEKDPIPPTQEADEPDE